MINAADLITPIDDQDIEWVSELMNLKDLDEPRKEYLKSLTTLDVSACPGSGKTTLLVAKLAIIARKWNNPVRGLCVLSHTNVAREEIEHKLGGNEVCQKLLSYPHFIDTIHAFVNRFLATPWLLSSGYKLTAIDNDLTIKIRRRSLTEPQYLSLNTFLEKKFVTFDSLRLGKADFSNPLASFPSGPDSNSYKYAASAIKHSSEQGYFCYDEIFVLGGALLDANPEIGSILSQRFPFVFIDEMQDTSEMQNSFLSRIFSRSSSATCVQRVGDPNQAIFEGDALSETDSFPDPTRYLSISNSFRFNATISKIANGFAYYPVNPSGLIGVRKTGEDETISHTIFVFPDNDTSGVLDAYGFHLIETFPREVLNRSIVTAIGAVHKEAADIEPGHKHYPKTISHYWECYQSKTANFSFKPNTLPEYILMAQIRKNSNNNLHRSVNFLAHGIAHLANLTAESNVFGSHVRIHREINNKLVTNDIEKQIYHDFIRRFVVESEGLNEYKWNTLKPALLNLGKILGGDIESQPVQDFLSWSVSPDLLDQVAQAETNSTPSNSYLYLNGEYSVNIQLGSIHMAKGQTHLATLILETFNTVHFFDKLLPWILGTKSNGNSGMSGAAKKRLLQAYVAMTRPTHLLCLAIRRKSFGTDEQFAQAQKTLADIGWSIRML